MKLETFEELINDTLLTIPQRIRDRMENVVFVVEDEPRPAVNTEIKITRGSVLLGLYQGVPMTRREPRYSLVLPDKITIFKSAIERIAGGDEGKITKLTHNTVLHEVAHHLGFDERAVRAWEHRRQKRPT
ncbi:MAG: metallopeptidase family protein [Patescibacteria group bacterium]